MSTFQNKNNFIQKSAKSTDEAIALALKELNATEDEVTIDIIQEASKGFLGFGAKDAIVNVTLNKKAEKKSPKKADKKAEPKKAVKKTAEKAAQNTVSVSSIQDSSDIVSASTAFLDSLFKAMKLEVKISANLDKDILNISLEGDNMGIIIGKHGDTLDSLQYLTSLVVNRKSDDYIKVTIDTENYRQKRSQALIALSNRLADKVSRTGKKFTLEPMNPYERRIIHSNLQNNADVTTFSVGQEPYRKVVIAPKNPKSRYEKKESKKPAPKNNDKSEVTAEKTGSYTTTYKADFKATPHKAEYKTYDEYLAAQNGEILPPVNPVTTEEE